MFKIQIKPRQKCAARRVASSSIIQRLSLRVDPVCLDMEKAQASERGLSVGRGGKSNALIMRLLYNAKMKFYSTRRH